MKKVILAAFMLIAVGEITMAQTTPKKVSGTNSQMTKKHHHKAHHMKKEAKAQK